MASDTPGDQMVRQPLVPSQHIDRRQEQGHVRGEVGNLTTQQSWRNGPADTPRTISLNENRLYRVPQLRQAPKARQDRPAVLGATPSTIPTPVGHETAGVNSFSPRATLHNNSGVSYVHAPYVPPRDNVPLSADNGRGFKQTGSDGRAGPVFDFAQPEEHRSATSTPLIDLSAEEVNDAVEYRSHQQVNNACNKFAPSARSAHHAAHASHRPLPVPNASARAQPRQDGNRSAAKLAPHNSSTLVDETADGRTIKDILDTAWPSMFGTQQSSTEERPLVWEQRKTNRAFKLPQAGQDRYEEAFEKAYDMLKDMNPNHYQMPFGSFVVCIKCGSLPNILQSIKLGVWACPQPVMKRIEDLWNARRKGAEIILLFSIPGSKAFSGVAVVQRFDKNRVTDMWEGGAIMEGLFYVRWIYCKIVSYEHVRHVDEVSPGQAVTQMWNGMHYEEATGRAVMKAYVEAPHIDNLLAKSTRNQPRNDYRRARTSPVHNRYTPSKRNQLSSPKKSNQPTTLAARPALHTNSAKAGMKEDNIVALTSPVHTLPQRPPAPNVRTSKETLLRALKSGPNTSVPFPSSILLSHPIVGTPKSAPPPMTPITKSPKTEAAENLLLFSSGSRLGQPVKTAPLPTATNPSLPCDPAPTKIRTRYERDDLLKFRDNHDTPQVSPEFTRLSSTGHQGTVQGTGNSYSQRPLTGGSTRQFERLCAIESQSPSPARVVRQKIWSPSPSPGQPPLFSMRDSPRHVLVQPHATSQRDQSPTVAQTPAQSVNMFNQCHGFPQYRSIPTRPDFNSPFDSPLPRIQLITSSPREQPSFGHGVRGSEAKSSLDLRVHSWVDQLVSSPKKDAEASFFGDDQEDLLRF